MMFPTNNMLSFGRKSGHHVWTLAIVVALSVSGLLQAQGTFQLTQTVKQVSLSERQGTWKTITARPPEIVGLKAGDRLKTGEFSSAVIEQPGKKTIRLDELTLIEFRTAKVVPHSGNGINVSQGLLYFLSRERSDDVEIRTPTCVGALRGTEFTVEVNRDGTSRFVMLGGALALSNPQGNLNIRDGQAAEVRPGQAPRLIPVIEARRAIQWNLYYPALVDASSMRFPVTERKVLVNSLSAYQTGDLLAAYEAFPWDRLADLTPTARTYAAGLLMNTGQVDEASAMKLGEGPDALALRGLIGTVRNLPVAPGAVPNDAAGWLARSYALQGDGNLPAARDAAISATHAAPAFGFAWARLGELELAKGNYRTAEASLAKALQLTPRNAYAWALQGFVKVSLHQAEAAREAFSQSVMLDGRQGNSWLGMGLMAYQQGRLDEGRRCLLIAASLEPNRALLRSYLARGLTESNEIALGLEEARHATRLDPLDPTPWFHSATLRQWMLDDRGAVKDLEKSLELNRNRRIHRTDPQLDADAAARRGNLATAYQRTGMETLAPKQASWASVSDFGNAESHLFLANSYDALRDPNGFELEMEAAWQNELLLANMLALPGSAVVGKTIGLQEYGAMFNHSGPSGQLRTYATDNGDFEQSFGHRQTTGTTSLALDLGYRDQTGFRTNSDGRVREAELSFSTAVGLQDSLYFKAGWSDVKGGDMFRLPWLGLSRPDLKYEDEFLPSLWLGYTHRWEAADAVTMIVTGHHEASQYFADSGIDTLNLLRNGADQITGAAPLDMDLEHINGFRMSSVEISHYQKFDSLRTMIGARAQWGEILTRDLLDNPPPPTAPFFANPPASARFSEDARSTAAYGYLWWDVNEQLTLQAGGSYENLSYPENFRNSPTSPGDGETDGFNLKAGLLWRPTSHWSLWGAYAQALGGVTFEEGMTLEPSHTVGMVHDYRSIISESLTGAVTAPEMDIASAGAVWRIGENSYLDADWRWRDSEVERTRGAFTLQGAPPLFVDSVSEQLDYQDQRVRMGLHFLMDHGLSLSLAWSWTHANLDQQLPELPVSGAIPPYSHYEATLQQPEARLTWQHRSGFFTDLTSFYVMQDNKDFPDDEVLVINAAIGYRNPDAGQEIRFGVANLADESYLLNPLTSRDDPVSQRTFFVEFKQTY